MQARIEFGGTARFQADNHQRTSFMCGQRVSYFFTSFFESEWYGNSIYDICQKLGYVPPVPCGVNVAVMEPMVELSMLITFHPMHPGIDTCSLNGNSGEGWMGGWMKGWMDVSFSN